MDRKVKEKNKSGDNLNNKAGLLEVIYYTDPLCCWSWGMEPQWRKFMFLYSERVSVRYCLGGLLPGWKNFNDSVNNVSRPVQMGPVWMHAREITGMPMNPNIWIAKAPKSSYPASVAVKCARVQSVEAEVVFLRLVREAVMIEGLDISSHAVLNDVAEKVEIMVPDFNLETFRNDMKEEKGLELFRKDLQEAQYYKISRFPTFVIKNHGTNQAVMIKGYRPFNLFIESIGQIADLSNPAEIDKELYKTFWRSLTSREIKEVETG